MIGNLLVVWVFMAGVFLILAPLWLAYVVRLIGVGDPVVRLIGVADPTDSFTLEGSSFPFFLGAAILVSALWPLVPFAILGHMLDPRHLSGVRDMLDSPTTDRKV